MRNIEEAFNEWMRRFVEQPDRFDHEWQAVQQFASEERSGFTPTYGYACSQYLAFLMDGESEPEASAPPSPSPSI